jgi:hypothetical protein
MIATIESFVIFIVLVGGLFLYRWLIRSRWFAHLVGGVIEVPPTNDEEIVTRMTTAEMEAQQRARDLEKEASCSQRTADRMRRKIGR